MSASPARRIAYDVLLSYERSGAKVGRLLNSRLQKAADDDPADRAFATELVYGVLRERRMLDAKLSGFIKKPLAKLDLEVLTILRLAAYQFGLESIPDYAAVDEAVKQVKKSGKRSAQSFVNGVLRSWLRKPPDEAALLSGLGPAERLALKYSLPDWLTARWSARYGDGAESKCAAENGTPPLTLRVNTVKTTRDELAAALGELCESVTPTAISPVGLKVSGASGLFNTELFRSGAFTVQDEASQLAGLLCAPAPGAKVIDLCAAPGGKAIHLAELVGEGGRVIAADRSARRLELVSEAAGRCGVAARMEFIEADLLESPPPASLYDVVLLDAPCTGLGTLRRNPEIRYRRREEDIARAAATQARMLDAAAGYVAPGGALIYAVCSLEPEEGEERAEQFAREHREFTIANGGEVLKNDSSVTEEGYLSTDAERHDCDGFFAARFIKAGSEQ